MIEQNKNIQKDNFNFVKLREKFVEKHVIKLFSFKKNNISLCVNILRGKVKISI